MEIFDGNWADSGGGHRSSSTPKLPAELLKSIHAGLAFGNAQAMKVAMDWIDQWAGKAFLNDLTVNIVDYRIKDASLARIVSEADDDLITEVEEALKKRQAQSQVQDNVQ